MLLDPALWPRHGTLWAHLVSDSSLEELHAFAQRAGIPPRAFDRDHYDVPAHRREELLALGAHAVDTRELVRRLRASGLRVTAAQRRALAQAPEHSDATAAPSGIVLPDIVQPGRLQ